MTSLLYFFLFLCVNLWLGLCEEIPNPEPALLVISFDGFHPAYMNRNVTPNLNKFRGDGTSAQYMIPVFPTKTFVNHFSIATGLYPEDHGVLGNTLYDTETGMKLKYGRELFHYNESVIPIWTANEMAGKHSGCFWPGSEFEYNGVSCTFPGKYKFGSNFEKRVDKVMSWFKHEKTPANLVMFYIEQPDDESHKYGPESMEVTEAIRRVDNLTGYIQQKLIENNLENRVNVIHLSDHGMIGVAPSNFIDLKQFVPEDACKFYGTSPTLQLVPNNPVRENEFFANLTKSSQEHGHFKVYNKHNFPARWRANNQRRIGPILVVADIGYAFQDQMKSAKFYEKHFNIPITNETVYGVHGYDSAEPAMRAFFMAKGPLISKGKRIKAVNAVDMKNLFCSILNIECGKNEGSDDPSIWTKLFAKYNNIENVLKQLH